MVDNDNTWSFSQTFTPQFQAMQSELETRIEAEKMKTPVSPDLLQDFSASLGKLTKALGDATGLIPAYDQKQYENQLKVLEQSIESFRISLPKAKFSFKRKQPLAQPPAPSVSESMQAQGVPPVSIGSIVFSSRSNEFLTTSSSHYTDVSIYDLDTCVVDLLGNADDEPPKISALHGHNLTNCILYLPLIEGSVLLYDLKQCTIVLGCHQFRMHSSSKVDVLLYISSNPIIELCQEIRFTRYVTDFLPHSMRSQHPLARSYSVQDFSHIRSTPSPNFSMLEVEETNIIEEKLLHLRRKGDAALSEIHTITPQ